MGMFDSVYDGTAEYQTKAFGEGGGRLAIGDEAHIVPVDPEKEIVSGERCLPPLDIKNFAVACLGPRIADASEMASSGQQWIVVEKGRVSAVTSEPWTELPRFDYYGRPAM